MNYIGAKNRLLPFLHRCIENEVGSGLKDAVFCDLFSGTGTVAKSFKPKVSELIANDLEYYSYALLKHYVGNNKRIAEEDYFQTLNQLDGTRGFISEQYGEGGVANRCYFSAANARKIDAIRHQFMHWKPAMPEGLYYFLLASFIESVDKVANTASVYGAFLKHIKKTAQKPLVVKPVETIEATCKTKVFQEDANSLITKIKGDVLYLDPPYNARQYGANYHLLNTIAQGHNFIPKGVTGLPNYNKSLYCSKLRVEEALMQLIEMADFQHIFLSYNNEGLISVDKIEKLLSHFGPVKLFKTEYIRFKADNDTNRNHKSNSTLEFLFYLQKAP